MLTQHPEHALSQAHREQNMPTQSMNLSVKPYCDNGPPKTASFVDEATVLLYVPSTEYRTLASASSRSGKPDT